MGSATSDWSVVTTLSLCAALATAPFVATDDNVGDEGFGVKDETKFDEGG